MRHMKYLPLCAAALMLFGCEKDSQSLDAKEERDPLVKTGQSYMEIKDWNKAEEAFKQAIENDPLMARPHLELALIYQQYKINYVHAIYHYDRYLELRPDSAKADLINEQKLKVAQALQNALINSSPRVKQVVDQLKLLQRENAELKARLAGTTPSPAPQTAPAATPQKTATQTVPKSAQPAPATTTAKPTHQIYHVVAGDTLSKIASKFYDDSGKYEIIYNANRDTMKNQNDLRIGQTLVIPAAGN